MLTALTEASRSETLHLCVTATWSEVLAGTTLCGLTQDDNTYMLVHLDHHFTKFELRVATFLQNTSLIR